MSVDIEKRNSYPVDVYKDRVADYINEDGLFPDIILRDEYWPLFYCEKVWIGNDLWWRFVL